MGICKTNIGRYITLMFSNEALLKIAILKISVLGLMVCRGMIIFEHLLEYNNAGVD